MTLTIKRDDTTPSISVTLTTAGTPVNLTGATSVRVLGRRQGATELLFDDTTPTVTAPATGVVVHDWVTGETDTTGRILIEVEVTWADGTVQTFPPSGHLAVDIGDDLD